jgi:hypothetical protein
VVDYAKLRPAVEDAGGTVGCDVCGIDNTEPIDSLVRLVAVDDRGQPEAGGGLDVLAMVCPSCSAVRLYSYRQLERLAEQRSA